jgi:perosamine synthetase
MIPIAQPYISEDEIQSVIKVLKSGKISQGKIVKEFEESFSDYIGCGHAIACVNGTAALHASLVAADVGVGDEVIVPSFSFISTATTVNMCGATPVFADVDPLTYTIDPVQVYDLITENTRAIVGVHLFGSPFYSQPLMSLCKDHDLVLIEDAAQAVGAKEYHRMCGTIGEMGCFSFYATKNVTTAEGGMITTNDDEYAEKVRKIINHGQSEKYKHTMIGYNYRMTDVLAAIGINQMNRVEDIILKRENIAKKYTNGINFGDMAEPPIEREKCRHVYHQYTIRCRDGTTRSDVMKFLHNKGVETAIHYPTPIHKQPVYMDMCDISRDVDQCPISTSISETIMSIPVHPLLTREEVTYIIDSLNGVFR